MTPILENCEGFDWDEGNSRKNWRGHNVTDTECEEVFFNSPLVIAINKRHLSTEQRFEALGQTNSGRHLFVAFTIRSPLVRVISAREMNKRENRRYEEEVKRNT